MLPRHPCPVCDHRTAEECEQIARSAPAPAVCEHCLHRCRSLASEGRPGPWLGVADRSDEPAESDPELELDESVVPDDDEDPA